MVSNPSILIYRNELLPSSETFILSQGEAMETFRSVYVGLKRVPGLELPDDRCIALSTGSFERAKAARFKFLGATKAEIAQLTAQRPALLHAHFGMDATSAMHLAARLGVPFLVTFHGFDATVRDEVFRRKSPALKQYVRRRHQLGRSASRIICVSEFIRGKVLAMGFPPQKTLVHYIGIDRQKFSPDLTVKRRPIVLFVGRLVEKKGCEYLIEAMKEVQERVAAELVVIGDGEMREKLQRLASSTLRHFRFLGSCSSEIVRVWMNQARVFSTPSVVAKSGDAEGFGMVFAEAQAMGLPVASFASGGIPEAVEHGVTGLLAPERDVDQLAENIVTLLRNRSLWQQFSEAGKDRVARLFDLERQTAKLEEIYSEVIEEHKARGAHAIAG
jgi:colanic acid/amylovoran biosynthesis glycosyltransferase